MIILLKNGKKNYKQRLKLKKKNDIHTHTHKHNNQQHKPLLSPNPALNKQASTDVAPFNINHSYNVYDTDIPNQYSPLTAGSINKKLYIKPKPKNIASQTLSLRSLTQNKPNNKSPKGSKKNKKKSPKPPKNLNISPKS
eukprot:59371_1